MGIDNKIRYAKSVFPAATWRAFRSTSPEPVHVILALADHFEPSIDADHGQKFVPRSDQERRVEWWTREYPKAVTNLRDHDGRPLVHTYFYPAEQYDETLVEMMAEHCLAGWGEIEIHLHHGVSSPDTPENTRRVLLEFRDRLAFRHRCLSLESGAKNPGYAFVHGNFALANSAGGRFCGVDSEMQILAETGCYADLTLPTAIWHRAQISKTNSIYECALPLDHQAPHRWGHDLRAGRPCQTLPLIIQGPTITDIRRTLRSRRPVVDNGVINRTNVPTMDRFSLWKRAGIGVIGRTDWVFIKLYCHSMNPTQKDGVIGDGFRKFLAELVGGARERKETLHFVTAREMANILFAACDGHEGNPGEYRDYRFKKFSEIPQPLQQSGIAPATSSRP